MQPQSKGISGLVVSDKLFSRVVKRASLHYTALDLGSR